MTLTIRPVRLDDAAELGAIMTDPEVMHGTMRLPLTPVEVVEQRISPEPGAYKIVAEIEGRVAGLGVMRTFPDIPRHNHVGEIDMVCVSADHRRQGVARALLEALIDLSDDWLQLRRLGLLVWTDNERAIALYEKLGFETEGVIRQYARRPGGFVDALMMGRLRS